MIDTVLLYLIANLYINSIFGFILALLLVESFLFLFRIKAQRIVFFLRMLPFFKIIVDILFNYNTPMWAIANGVDIVNRLPFSMNIFISASLNQLIPFFSIKLFIYRFFSVSITDLLTQNAGPQITFYLVVILLSGSCIMLLRGIFSAIFDYFKTFLIFSQSKLISPDISNPKLIKQMKQNRIKVYISDNDLLSPFSAGILFPKILVPANLYKKLTPDELEALMAHELEHIRWLDIIWKILLDIISSIFWCIPFIGWYNKKLVSQSREYACDMGCSKYSISVVSLAQVVKKAAETIFYRKLPSFTVPFVTRSNLILNRINFILYSNKGNKSWLDILVIFITAFISIFMALIILKSRFGIF